MTYFDNKINKDRTIEFLNDPQHHLIVVYDKENLLGMGFGFHYVHLDKDPTLFIDEVGVIDAY